MTLGGHWMKRFLQTVMTATAIVAGGPTLAAGSVEQTIVYIECKSSDGEEVNKGTGVLVSHEGHVITAGYLFRKLPSPVCRGSIGEADSGALRRMIVQPVTVQVDAALLRFTESREYDFVSPCSLENWMVRRKVFIAGFPSTSKSGAPSFREGVLSTVVPGEDGLIETDGQTAPGMGGAPVFAASLGGLVGIVMGARFEVTGTISSYEILPIALYAQSFGLRSGDKPCFHKSREVDLSDRVSTWKTGDGPVKLGVRAEDGTCFLSGIWGQFNNVSDSIKVELQDGEYVLIGMGQLNSQIGASARCIWYE
jgi:hypothetical protein